MTRRFPSPPATPRRAGPCRRNARRQGMSGRRVAGIFRRPDNHRLLPARGLSLVAVEAATILVGMLPHPQLLVLAASTSSVGSPRSARRATGSGESGTTPTSSRSSTSGGEATYTADRRRSVRANVGRCRYRRRRDRNRPAAARVAPRRPCTARLSALCDGAGAGGLHRDHAHLQRRNLGTAVGPVRSRGRRPFS